MASDSWVIFRDEQEHGPITQDEFRKFVELGHLKVDDLVWHDGVSDWMPATTFLTPDTTLRADAPPALLHAREPEGGKLTSNRAQTPARKSWINKSSILWGIFILVMIVVGIGEPNSIPYRLAGAINGAIFGGLAGGLAGLLQYVIQRRLTVAPVSIAMVVGFIVGQATENSINFIGGTFYENTVKPRVTQELILQQLDQMPIYQAMRRADPEAYSRLRSEVGNRMASGASGRDIETYTETYAASIRRANAAAALSAPPEALAALVQSLRNILDHLHFRDAKLCAEYVVQAFASERIRALAREPDFSALIQQNAITIFDTIAEGLRHRTTYQALADADIQFVIQKLQMRGWTDEMRTALAEPSQLRTLPPELVCRIHREWFATLASLPDPARTRWYREVLGPLLRS